MKALISPNEPVFNPNTGEQIGIRVCEVQPQEFEVALPLFWTDCPEYVVADVYCYNNGEFIEVPEPVPADQPAVEGAQTL